MSSKYCVVLVLCLFTIGCDAALEQEDGSVAGQVEGEQSNDVGSAFYQIEGVLRQVCQEEETFEPPAGCIGRAVRPEVNIEEDCRSYKCHNQIAYEAVYWTIGSVN